MAGKEPLAGQARAFTDAKIVIKSRTVPLFNPVAYGVIAPLANKHCFFVRPCRSTK